MKLRIEVLTSLYPSEVHPVEGVFAERRWLEMHARGHEVRVTQPLPLASTWLPRARWRALARIPARETRGGILEHLARARIGGRERARDRTRHELAAQAGHQLRQPAPGGVQQQQRTPRVGDRQRRRVDREQSEARRVERESGGPGAGEGSGVETERRIGTEVAGIEGLQRMPSHHLVRFASRHDGDDIAQFAQRHGGRPVCTGDGIGAGVEQQDTVAGGHQRVEQQLPILAARITFSHNWIECGDVVAVDVGAAREVLVVEPEQHQDPMRHRPHRDHRADGELTGAEVRPCRPAREPAREHGPHVGQTQLRVTAVLDGGDQFTVPLEVK